MNLIKKIDTAITNTFLSKLWCLIDIMVFFTLTFWGFNNFGNQIGGIFCLVIWILYLFVCELLRFECRLSVLEKIVQKRSDIFE